MHKVCSKCRLEKSLDAFFVKDSSKNRLHAQCKVCYQKHRQTYAAAHYQKYRPAYLARAADRRAKLRFEFRTRMLSYLEDKTCVMCNESDIRVLEFDHLDSSRKVFTVSQAVKLGYAWEDVLVEISKCQILCANCHKKRTAEQFGWYKK